MRNRVRGHGEDYRGGGHGWRVSGRVRVALSCARLPRRRAFLSTTVHTRHPTPPLLRTDGPALV